jgi:hypothetical protein
MTRAPGTAPSGHSLPELLVALLLFALGAAAAGRLHASARALYGLAAQRGSLNERAQFVLGVLEPELQMAGFPGGAAAAPRLADPTPPLPVACGAALVTRLDVGIEATDGRYPLPCAPSGGGVVAGTDHLTVRRASARVVAADVGRLQYDGAPGGAERRDLLVRSYYVARAADGEAGATRPTPALRVKSLSSIAGRPTFIDTEVMPGVEDLQVEIGWRGPAGELRFAPEPPAGAVAVAVRIWLLLRGDEPDPALPPPAPMTYAGRTVVPEERFHRLLVRRSYGLRNAGIALPLVLVLLAVTGVLLVQGLAGATGELALAGQFAARQQAFIAAENGTAIAVAALARTGAAPPAATHRFDGTPRASVLTEVRSVGAVTLVEGYGEGDFVARRFEVVGRGESSQGARVRVVQGATLTVPAGGVAP